MKMICVGLGGALGAIFRYEISLLTCRCDFPILTLITNFLGAILIGVIVGVSMKKNLSENKILFLKTGLCGGFTTFSTFSLESYNLIQSGKPVMAIFYIGASVVLCLMGVAVGLSIGNRCGI